MEEPPQVGAGGVPAVAEHDRAEGVGGGHLGLEPARPGEAVVREQADPCATSGATAATAW